ncbi:cysteine-rich venom protein Cau1-like isoform X2 [Rhineura floridana]|uniref:cysteine-rich venom protein Cau1-like isoform X2 n=2 Tax=Rhineura floridana TaxID=261503 RepID=UPI002AC85FC3|nr:cysteine-rich venom protein Cau1-like isoform X2 [Rhineura floridana]
MQVPGSTLISMKILSLLLALLLLFCPAAPGGICGENILQSSYSTSWLAVIEVWQRKESNFKYGIGTIDPRKNIYSYSQLVWYKAHQIGCALAYCPGKSYPFLYICRYCPRGIGIDHLAMPYKEGPPCEDCPYDCEDKLCTNPCRYEDRKMDCKAVISLFSCKSSFEQQCEATCKCTTEIN